MNEPVKLLTPEPPEGMLQGLADLSEAVKRGEVSALVIFARRGSETSFTEMGKWVPRDVVFSCECWKHSYLSDIQKGG